MSRITEGSYATPEVNSVSTTGLLAATPVCINRKRYVELTLLAKQTCDWLEEKGLKRGEQCVFSRIAQDLWFSE